MKTHLAAALLAAFVLVPTRATRAAGLEIVLPAPGQAFYQDQEVACRARWSGEPPAAAAEFRYVWSSDVDGRLAEGLETVLRGLSYRTHRLRVEALDGDSVLAGEEVPLVIAASPVQFTLSARNDWEGEFSPRGTMVAFTSFRSGDPEIWTASSNGQGTERITYQGGWGPSWSADGNRLVFWSERAGSRDIWLVNLEDDPKVAEPLVSESCPEWAPVFSPLDSRVVYIAKQQKSLSLKLVDADDPERQTVEVVGPEYYPMFPRWLPDASGVIFTSFADSLPVVCQVSLDSGQVARITGPGAEDADISPDGKWLVMVRDRDLWLHRMSDSLERPLTLEKAGAMCPRFSPNGKLVIYGSNRSGNYDLWLLSLPEDL
ncbi:MAG: PD40 domain-containing protein [Candidatus Glassbacteria bacterium]|nr:PD40 domain-containing protein [Candidatus Glassbacteria bacterium]